ncbi:MAG: di-heme oxidoredictase family protein [Pseudomonadota bacterium]
MQAHKPLALALLLSAAGLSAAPIDDPEGEKSGGEATVFATGRNAFSFPAANLTDAERTRFVIGNSFFKRNWVEAPSSTTARDGLGPHFIARSCGGCHVSDGRGEPPKPGDQPVSLLLRLSVPGVGAHGGVVPEPTYGDQFDNFAVQKVKPEGRVVITHVEVKGRFADGTPYTLKQPRYAFADLGYGPMARDVLVSPRVAPQIIGVGLLEAIAETDILANAREQAVAGGPVRGVPNRVWDAPSGRMMLGRFGWKANVATIAHQTAGAFNGDIGITSGVFPDEACTAAQRDCLAAPSGDQRQGAPGREPEIDARTLGDVVFYQATLAPPARRNVDDPRVRQGRQLFAQAQCATCHRPDYVTTAGPNPRFSSPALNGQRIHPYTDLLLHDMGEGLADGRPDGQANGRQWKTPPLWGVGLIKDVNGHTRLLHDGRANGVLEAILWHGGEAEASRDRVLKMDKAQRAALVKFVESL